MSGWRKMLIVLGIVAIGASGLGIWRGYQTWQAAKWEQAPGWMRDCDVQVIRGRFGQPDSYHLVVRYEYEHRGHRYFGNRFGFTLNTVPTREAAGQFAPGRKVTCFVNPLNPSESALNRDIDNDELIVSAGLFFAGVFFFVKAFRAGRSAGDQSDESAGWKDAA